MNTGKLVTIRFVAGLLAVLCMAGLSFGNPVLTPGAWTNITPTGSNPTTANPFWYIALAPSNRNIIYACQEASGGGHGNIWKSTNGGETWTGMNTGSLPANYGATTTTWIDNPQMPPSAVDPTNPDHLFCNDPGWGGDGKTFGLWESTDGGHNWKQPPGWAAANAAAGSSDAGRFETDRADYRHMLLSFRYTPNTFGYLESKDGGVTFIVHQPPFAWPINTHGLHFLHNDGDPGWTQVSHTWLVTTEVAGFWRTTDGGTTWTVDNTATGRHGGTENIYYGHNGDLYCGGTGDIWRSTDNGLTWHGVGAGYAYWPTIYGDGQNLYACNMGGAVVTALESNPTKWQNLSAQPGGTGAAIIAMNAFDPVNRILYGALDKSGVWAYKLPNGGTATVHQSTPSGKIVKAPLVVAADKGLAISVPENVSWTLTLISLNGVRVSSFSGVGSGVISNVSTARGIAIAELTAGGIRILQRVSSR